jgi:hypothetical protein
MAVSSPHGRVTEPGEVPGNGAIPPLKDGDRLPRAEFERRYMAMPELKKAELIEGVVHVSSPVRQRYHGRQHSHFNFWLCAYEGRTPGVEVGDNSTVRLDIDNMPQPDCLLFDQPEHGGQVRIGEFSLSGERSVGFERRLLAQVVDSCGKLVRFDDVANGSDVVSAGLEKSAMTALNLFSPEPT